MDFGTDVAMRTVGTRAVDSGTPKSERLEKAALDFEAYVLDMLLKEMRKTVGDGGLFGDHTSDTYQTMMYEAIARRAAEAGTFGLAQQLIRQIEGSP